MNMEVTTWAGPVRFGSQDPRGGGRGRRRVCRGVHGFHWAEKRPKVMGETRAESLRAGLEYAEPPRYKSPGSRMRMGSLE